MALIAFAIPILPGKTPEWRAWMQELKDSRQQEFAESRRGARLHERTFLQQTPMGDLVIITLEGDDPGQAFGQLLTDSDAFSKWFGEHAMAAHGDLQLPTTGSPSELVADSEWA